MRTLRMSASVLALACSWSVWSFATDGSPVTMPAGNAAADILLAPFVDSHPACHEDGSCGLSTAVCEAAMLFNDGRPTTSDPLLAGSRRPVQRAGDRRPVQRAGDRRPDFEKVHKVMCALDWKWADYDRYDVPSISRMITHASVLLMQVVHSKEEDVWISTGGFKAHKDKNNTLTLEFIVTSSRLEQEGWEC